MHRWGQSARARGQRAQFSAPELLATADGCSTYGAKVTLFCDVHGADVHNVVVATLKASVVPA